MKTLSVDSTLQRTKRALRACFSSLSDNSIYLKYSSYDNDLRYAYCARLGWTWALPDVFVIDQWLKVEIFGSVILSVTQ